MSSKRSKDKLENRNKRVLALDPGTNNFAWSVVRKNKVLACGFVEKTVSDLTDKQFEAQLKAFIKEIRKLIRDYKPDMVAAERYMVRGRWFGASCEKINIMLGALGLICLSKGIKVQIISSALWKNRTQRDQYKDYLKDTYAAFKKLKIPPHVVDASYIGAYFTEPAYTKKCARRINRSLERKWKRMSAAHQK